MRLLAAELIKASYPIVKVRKTLGKTYPPSTFMMTEEQKPVYLNHQVDDHQNYEKSLERKNLVLLVRKSQGWGLRFWHETEVKRFVEELTKQFPNHNILTHSSDSVLHPDFCYACEINEMTTADILVGELYFIFNYTKYTFYYLLIFYYYCLPTLSYYIYFALIYFLLYRNARCRNDEINVHA